MVENAFFRGVSTGYLGYGADRIMTGDELYWEGWYLGQELRNLGELRTQVDALVKQSRNFVTREEFMRELAACMSGLSQQIRAVYSYSKMIGERVTKIERYIDLQEERKKDEEKLARWIEMSKTD